MQGPEKNSYKEFDNEKKFLQLENSPPPPHNFSNGPSLTGSSILLTVCVAQVCITVVYQYNMNK